MTMDTHDAYEIGQIYEIPIESIHTNPTQPRQTFEREPLEALKLSIAREGLLQPIAVICDEANGFIIAAGERRYRAVKELGWTTIPARIVAGNIHDLAVMENMIREDLNPMERAIAMQSYLAEHKCSRKKLATILGIARNSISEVLSLNRLPKEIQEVIIKDKRYSLHNMRIIARIHDPEEQMRKFEKLRAKIEKTPPPAEPVEEDVSKNFKVEVKRDRLLKMTNEVKNLQLKYSKKQLRELRGQVVTLYEQIQALLYKIGEDVSQE